MSRAALAHSEHHLQVEALGVAEMFASSAFVAGAIAGQGDAATLRGCRKQACRAVAIAVEAMTSVVVEQGRNEVKLDVGALVRRQFRSHEAAGLGDIAAVPGPLCPCMVVLLGDAQVAEAVVSDRLGGALQGADVEMVLQIFGRRRRDRATTSM